MAERGRKKREKRERKEGEYSIAANKGTYMVGGKSNFQMY
jgi:hypothetical protein